MKSLVLQKTLSLVLPTIINLVLTSFSEEKIKEYLDDIIDMVEDRIAMSPSELDDFFLPILLMLREMFHIPDNDPQDPS